MNKEKTMEATEEKKSKKGEKITIAHIIVKRTMMGVSIGIKSKTIEEFFKGVCNGYTSILSKAKWGQGERYYRVEGSTEFTPTITSDRYQISLNLPDSEPLLSADDVLNLTFLRVKGISEGKTFNFNGLYRESDVGAISQAINEGLKNLFKEYNTPACYEIELTTEK